MIRHRVMLGDAEYILFVDEGKVRRIHRIRDDCRGGKSELSLDINAAKAQRVIAEWRASQAAKPKDALSLLWNRSA